LTGFSSTGSSNHKYIVRKDKTEVMRRKLDRQDYVGQAEKSVGKEDNVPRVASSCWILLRWALQK